MKRKLWDSLEDDSKPLQIENGPLDKRPKVSEATLQANSNPIIVEADDLYDAQTLSDRNASSAITRPTLQEPEHVLEKEAKQAQHMTNLYSRAMQVQREAPTLQATTKALLDQQREKADEAGLDLDDYLRDYVGPLHETANDNAKRAQARFVDETSSEPRERTDNPEIAALMRDILQSVPSNNERMATQVMREILEARDRAVEMYFRVPMVNRSQRPVLQMWALSKRKPMCDLASSILARLED